jgi:hypothetical protein
MDHFDPTREINQAALSHEVPSAEEPTVWEVEGGHLSQHEDIPFRLDEIFVLNVIIPFHVVTIKADGKVGSIMRMRDQWFDHVSFNLKRNWPPLLQQYWHKNLSRDALARRIFEAHHLKQGRYFVEVGEIISLEQESEYI